MKMTCIELGGCTQLEVVLKIRNAADKSGPAGAPASAHHILHTDITLHQKQWGYRLVTGTGTGTVKRIVKLQTLSPSKQH